MDLEKLIFLGVSTVLGILGWSLRSKHDELTGKVKQLEHDRKRDRRRIVQLVQVLRDNNIPVPLEVPDPDDEEAEAVA